MGHSIMLDCRGHGLLVLMEQDGCCAHVWDLLNLLPIQGMACLA